LERGVAVESRIQPSPSEKLPVVILLMKESWSVFLPSYWTPRRKSPSFFSAFAVW
jgi:hypothetical protein